MSDNKILRCECPEKGIRNKAMMRWYDPETEWPFVKHEPGECRGTNDIALYKRGDKRLWLCSCCHMTGDEEIPQ